MMPIALKAVQLQLRAMGAQRYELGVRVPPELADNSESHMTLRNGQNDDGLTIGEVFDKLDWCAAENAQGHHIYIRPSGPSQLTLIDNLTRKGLDTLLDTGYTPACVVETSPGNFQAWLKHAWTLTKEEGTVAAKILAEKFGGDPNSADWRHFGRLAGSTNPKPKYKNSPMGSFPTRNSNSPFRVASSMRKPMRFSPKSKIGCSNNCRKSGDQPQHASATRNIPARLLNSSTMPTSPICFPLKANATKQIFPMPPTPSNEACPKSKSATPSALILQHPPLSTAPKGIKTPISIAP